MAEHGEYLPQADLCITPEQVAELQEALNNLPRDYVPKILPPRRPSRPREFEGVIRISWRDAGHGALPGWAFAVHDADGNLITTVSGLSIHADVEGLAWAECEMWADGEGRPVYGTGECTQVYLDAEKKNILTGVFAFEVASMSVVP